MYVRKVACVNCPCFILWNYLFIYVYFILIVIIIVIIILKTDKISFEKFVTSKALYEGVVYGMYE